MLHKYFNSLVKRFVVFKGKREITPTYCAARLCVWDAGLISYFAKLGFFPGNAVTRTRVTLSIYTRIKSRFNY